MVGVVSDRVLRSRPPPVSLNSITMVQQLYPIGIRGVRYSFRTLAWEGAERSATPFAHFKPLHQP